MGFLKKLARKCGEVVTVDRGAETALRMGAVPSLHVGDGDSTNLPTVADREISRRRLAPLKQIILPQEKNISDLEYALQILPLKATKVIVGAHRDHEHRTDHVFINLLLALKYPNTFWVDEKMWIQSLGVGKFTLRLKAGETFSVVPLRPTKVKIRGAKYDVDNKVFKTPSMGLSNVSTGRPLTIQARGPALLFVASNFLSRPQG